jgi:hypothetical protein
MSKTLAGAHSVGTAMIGAARRDARTEEWKCFPAHQGVCLNSDAAHSVPFAEVHIFSTADACFRSLREHLIVSHYGSIDYEAIYEVPPVDVIRDAFRYGR